jgi:hypothetical protein
MFSKGKYLAILLFLTFTFRIFFLSISVTTPLNTPQTKAFAVKSFKHIYKRRKPECVQYNTQVVVIQAEVSEEPVESDSSEHLEKGSKYPSVLSAFSNAFKTSVAGISSGNSAERFIPRYTSPTYLSLSVLRI